MKEMMNSNEQHESPIEVPAGAACGKNKCCHIIYQNMFVHDFLLPFIVAIGERKHD